MVFVRGCKNPKAVSILVRGSTEHVVDEVDRAIEDAVGAVASALEVGKVVAGAGSPEAELACQLKRFAQKYSGREQLAILAFATAMEIIPRALAENAGLDPIDILVELRAAHERGRVNWGIDLEEGKVADAYAMNVVEPLKVKTQAVKSAAEAAQMILRIDDVISAGKAEAPTPPTPPSEGPEEY
jgi:chaperonin GroEL (HSP60 family)